MNIDIKKFIDLFEIKGQVFGNKVLRFLERDKMAPLMF